ncbi:MAG: Hsp70 family protein [Anaerolineae bacterium]|nr:Hsp70 family protein [Anaerolineae bacterium]
MRIGIDFGTTNSGAAWFDGKQVHLFPIDPTSANPTVIRSVLYITCDGETFVGKEAIDQYYAQNIGRATRMARKWIGEIEVEGGDMYFIRDVYVLVDELLPGRLLRSLKSGLATTYDGTQIFDRYHTLEALIAIYLRTVRERVEKLAGEKVDHVVLGRPVNFVGEAEYNQQAQKRLRQAAEMAGYTNIDFELEPIAAALSYELSVTKPQNIVVFDFGGGTLDITVMRVGHKSGRGDEGSRKVYATGGVGIAGDMFDRRIIEGLMLEHFGRGSTVQMGVDRAIAPFPSQYTDALTNWQTVLDLNRPETLRFFSNAEITSSQPARIRALASLVINNYAMHLFDEMERAKIALSDAFFDLIQVQGEDIHIWQPIARGQFEALIADETQRVETCLLDTLKASGLGADDIDAVVRTGGSAQIPRFVEMLGQHFGPQKVVLADVFNSVTAGLAIRAAMT